MIDKNTVFLVIDDFASMRMITSSQLRVMGAHNILIAENGAEALRILKVRRVDIVLSDWNMPVMTGLELLKIVRADQEFSHLPFIMISAEADHQRIEEAIKQGVSDLLVKPYTAELLATRVERALFAIPRTRIMPVAQADPPPLLHVKKPERQTILVVDDAEDNRLLLAELFKDEYRVRIATSGEKALEICQSNDPPDLVLLDIMMPGIDGFEVAKRMRLHPTSEIIPIIFVTSMCGKDARLKGLEPR